MSGSVPTYDICIDPKDLENGAREILKQIRPDWISCDIKIRNVTNGFINKLVICSYGDNMNNAVVIKVFPSDDCIFFDRERTVNSTLLANEAKLSPKLICTFKNGQVHSFLEGKPLGWEDAAEFVSNEKLGRSVMRELARWHSKSNLTIAKKLGLDISKNYKIQDMKILINDWPIMDVKDPRSKEIWSKKEIEEEVQKVEDMINKMGLELTLLHGDTNPANFIYDEKADKVTLIDYDESGIDVLEWDLTNLFTSVAFCMSRDGEDFKEPSEEWQISMLQEYLVARKELGDIEGDISEDVLKTLLINTSKMTLPFILGFLILVVHFEVTPTKEHSDTPIHVDYLDVALKCQKKYLEVRDILLAL